MKNIAILMDAAFDIILNENSIKSSITNVLCEIVPAEKIWDLTKFKEIYFSEMEYMMLKKEVIKGIYAGVHQDLIMGDFSYGNPDIITVSHSQKCRVGKVCSIAPEVSIILCADHRGDWITTYPLMHVFRNFHT